MINSTMQVKKHIQSKIAKSDSPCENQLAWRRTGLCISLVQSTMNLLYIILCLHTGELLFGQRHGRSSGNQGKP